MARDIAEADAAADAAGQAHASQAENADTDHPALALRGLSKAFGATVAADGIDLDIPAGSFYGMVGPNGAGKTTTLSMATGLLVPDSGTVDVHGVSLWHFPEEAKPLLGVLPDGLQPDD